MASVGWLKLHNISIHRYTNPICVDGKIIIMGHISSRGNDEFQICKYDTIIDDWVLLTVQQNNQVSDSIESIICNPTCNDCFYALCRAPCTPEMIESTDYGIGGLYLLKVKHDDNIYKFEEETKITDNMMLLKTIGTPKMIFINNDIYLLSHINQYIVNTIPFLRIVYGMYVCPCLFVK